MHNLGLLIKRGTLALIKSPAGPMGGLAMSLFFLVVYSAGIGGIGHLPEFGGKGYFAFLFPMGIISISMGSSAGAGLSLHRDLQSGYYRRLFLSPVKVWILTLAPIIVDIIAIIFCSTVLILISLPFGLVLNYGISSFMGLLLISALWGTFLSSLSAGLMIRTGNHQLSQAVTTAVFPLIFLSNTFMPASLVESGWLKFIAQFNPVTYLFDAMRYLLAGTASIESFLTGLLVALVLSFGALFFVFLSPQKILN